MNWKVRIKNWRWYLGILATILASIGATPEMFTSWSIVGQKLYEVISNPFLLGCVVIAIVGQCVDPTTDGFKDSNRAMMYHKPFKDVG